MAFGTEPVNYSNLMKPCNLNQGPGCHLPIDLTVSIVKSPWITPKEFNEMCDVRSGTLKLEESICKICGDKASGRHYGVLSCEGCKGFFKRCVRKEMNPVCRAGGNCEIKVATRNRCQHCRLQKCRMMGMKHESVSCERKPLSVANNQSRKNDGESSPEAKPEGKSTFDHLGVLETENEGVTGGEGSKEPMELVTVSMDLDEKVKSEEIAGSAEVNGGVNESKNSVTITDDISSQLLLRSLVWIQDNPLFQKLSRSVQESLLGQAWVEMFVLDLAAGIAFQDRVSTILDTFQYMEDYKLVIKLRTIINSVKKLNPTKEELNALKLFTVYCPTRVGTEFQSDVKDFVTEIRTYFMNSLVIYLSEEIGNYFVVAKRMGELMLVLAPLREIPAEFIEQRFFPGTFGSKTSIRDVLPYLLNVGNFIATSPQAKDLDLENRVKLLVEVMADWPKTNGILKPEI